MEEPRLGTDGLPVDEVGTWAKEKHLRIQKYVDISHAARRKFVTGSGGATYIDLFCGTGRARIRDTDEEIDGSPVIAFKSAEASGVPFSELHIADVSSEACNVAANRLIAIGAKPIRHVGEATKTAKQIVNQLNPHGLHFGFLDPFNLDDLSFEIIEAFSKLRRIDLLVHFSAQDLQRNFDAYSSSNESPLDRVAPGWRNVVDLRQSQSAVRAAFVTYWASKIEQLGLPPAERAELVTGSRNQRLYWLVFISRSEFAKRLWDEIRNISGQKSLFD